MRQPVSKAVILARGLGTRMRRPDALAKMTPDQARIAESGVKAMIPIGRPFMDYIISALADAGLRGICLVIGPDHQIIRDYYERLRPRRATITFAIQQDPLGTADAVLAAETFAAGDNFVVLNSDNYYPLSALRSLAALDGSGLVAFSTRILIERGKIPAERVRSFPGVEVGTSGLLSGLVESSVESHFVSMNCWRMGPAIFTACRAISPSSRQELELPDAVRYAINQLDEPFQVVLSEEPVLDVSRRADIAGVAEQLRDIEVDL